MHFLGIDAGRIFADWSLAEIEGPDEIKHPGGSPVIEFQFENDAVAGKRRKVWRKIGAPAAFRHPQRAAAVVAAAADFAIERCCF